MTAFNVEFRLPGTGAPEYFEVESNLSEEEIQRWANLISVIADIHYKEPALLDRAKYILSALKYLSVEQEI